MDLKDVIQTVVEQADEAQKAFNAGHHDNAEKHLHTIEGLVVEYLRMPATPAGDVTGSTNHENPEADQSEQPAAGQVDYARQTPLNPPAPGQQLSAGSEESKQTQ